MRGSRRCGFSLIELCVALSVASVLVSLLLVAVQAVRERVRQAQCASNLRQLSLSIHNFEAIHKCLPKGVETHLGDDGIAAHYSLWTRILHHMEEGSLASSFRFNLNPFHPLNSTLVGTNAPPLLRCASDPFSDSHLLSPIGLSPASWSFNYAGSVGVLGGLVDEVGVSSFSPDAVRFAGVFRQIAGVRTSEVGDGMSSTAMLSERMIGTSDNPLFRGDAIPFADFPRLPNQFFILDAASPNRLSLNCSGIPPTHPTWSRSHNRMWYSAEYSYYNHVLPPNSIVSDCSDGLFLGIGVLSARNYHGFGSNVAFADGHVSMIPNSIDLVVWRALGSRSGDEILASVLDE